MNKRFWISSLCLLPLLLLFVSVGCTKESPAGKEPPVSREPLSPTPTARPTLGMFTEEDTVRVDKDNQIEREDIAGIFLGDKQEAVIRRIGFPNEVVSSGHYIVQYRCSNGEYLQLWYDWEKNEGWEGFVVCRIVLDDEPW